MNLGSDAWITAGIVVLSFAVLLLTNIAADAVLLSAAIALMLLGILSPEDMMAGFSNLGLATVGILFVVASALTRTGALASLFNQLLGSPKSVVSAQSRMMLPVALISSVLNNTPVVAMMIPMVSDWAKRMGISVSQLMMPLSYAAIVGGVCTVIGTSTNLVVNDMLESSVGSGFDLFELAWVGIPIVLVTMVFTAVFGRWLLPDRNQRESVFGDAKQYTIEMVVSGKSPLDGQTIETAGLRNLSGMYLVEIIRNSHVMAAVSPDEELKASDRLIFAGDVDSIVDLQKIRGLEHAYISKRIRILETTLKTKLLHRTTRKIVLTDDGERTQRWAIRILADIDDMVDDLSQAQYIPRGLLHICSTFGFGRKHVATAMSSLAEQYPQLDIRLEVFDRGVDIIQEGFDLEVRVGEDLPQQHICKLLKQNDRILCASPKYLKEHGTPKTTEDLQNHDCLVLKERSSPFGIWNLSYEGKETTVSISGPLSTNNGEIVRQWALQHRGIVLRSVWDLKPYLDSGEIVQVLPGYTQKANIWAVYPTRLSHSAKLRVCVEFLEKYLKENT